MRIVSYNVNGLRSRLSSRTLAAFLDLLDADIICLQETKVARQELTADIAVAEGYESFFSCTRTVQKGRIGYSGVATFCRVGIVPCRTSPILPLAADEGFTGLLHRSQIGDIEGGKGRVGGYEEVAKTELSMQELLRLDSEGRCLITDHGSFVLFNLYCPRVQCGDGERLEFKVNFFSTLQRRWEALLKQNRRIIAVGDFNISPYPIDSCAPGQDFDKNVCRKWLRSLLKNEGGPFWDVFRFFHQDRKEAYTCWSSSTGAEEFNFGTRIDLVLAAGLCNHEISSQSRFDETKHGFVPCEMQDSDILTQFRRLKPDTLPRWHGGRSLKLEGSDHAPVVVHLKEQSPVEPHDVPPLAARFMPEIRGRQQNLVSLLNRQALLPDSKDAETRIKLQLTEPTELSYGGRRLEGGPNASLVNLRRKLPAGTIRVAGKRKEMQSFPSAEKSDFQQKDLRAFFVPSSSQTKALSSNEEVVHPSLTVYANSTQGENNLRAESRSFTDDLDVGDKPEGRNFFNLADEDFEGTISGADGLDSGEPFPVRNEFFNGREDQHNSASQIESDCRKILELDVELLKRVEQSRAAAETKTANAAWSRIKEKMARAVPLCQGHDEPCVARIVKKPGPNKGRGFYVCARAEGPSSNAEARCAHFEWASSFKKPGKPLDDRNGSEQLCTFLK